MIRMPISERFLPKPDTGPALSQPFRCVLKQLGPQGTRDAKKPSTGVWRDMGEQKGHIIQKCVSSLLLSPKDRHRVMSHEMGQRHNSVSHSPIQKNPSRKAEETCDFSRDYTIRYCWSELPDKPPTASDMHSVLNKS